MKDVVIVAAKRSAIGRLGGSLKNINPEHLSKFIIEAIITESGIEKDLIDKVIFGQTKQSSDAPNIARVASLMAGLSESIPSYTVHMQCASGMQAIIDAVLQIKAGYSDVVIAGGVESMSRAQYYMRNGRYGYKSGNGELLDPNTESQPRSQPQDIYGYFNMGITAENIAEKYDISRAEQDDFSLDSQHKAIAAIDKGRFKEEIAPFFIKEKGQTIIFKEDEFPRRDTSVEKLAKLRPVFKEAGTVTAGSSSGRNDGVSAVLVMSAEKAKELNLKPLVRFVSSGASGVDPRLMGLGPVPSIKKTLKRAGLELDQIGRVELNEAFAAQSLGVVKELNINKDILNVNGGAIALGHPLGCSGNRIAVTLIHEMLNDNVKYGLASLCVAGGQGVSIIFENLSYK